MAIQHAIVEDDPRLHDAIFLIEGTARAGLYCGPGFRARARRLGVVGLSFKKIGYFYSAGDPEPPAYEVPVPRTVAPGIGPPWRSEDLEHHEVQQLSVADERARRRLALASNAPVQAVLDALATEVVELRKVQTRQPMAPEKLLELSSLYGGLFVAELGWSWCRLIDPQGQPALGVLDAKSECAVASGLLIDTLVTHPQRDITLALQFNMARMGLFPPVAPGELAVLQ